MLHNLILALIIFGYLRGELSLLQFLKPGTPVGRSKDMSLLADTLEILHSTPSKIVLPADLRRLIGLFKNFDPKYYDLVIVNICHESEAMKCSIFVKMFNRLMVLERTDKRLYRKIMKSIPYAKVWIREASMNAHLPTAMRYDGSKPGNIKALVTPYLITPISYKSTACLIYVAMVRHACRETIQLILEDARKLLCVLQWQHLLCSQDFRRDVDINL
jgi:hypothetical protein